MTKNSTKMTSLLSLALIACYSVQAYAQTCPGSAGCLDLTFGNSGFASVSVNNGVASGWAVDVDIQADGKIVVAVDSANVEDPNTGDWYVLRFNTDGTLDSSFGNGGVSRFAFSSTYDTASVRALRIQPDGKILVAGSPGGGVAGLARLDANGALDASFGSGGKVSFQFANRETAFASAISVHSDGRIMVGGTSANSKFGFARFNTNGTKDTTFNSGGTLAVAVGSKNNGGGLEDVIIQSDGKYVASGLNGSSKGKPQTWTLMRVNSNGALDSSFGSGGMAVTQFGGTWSVARNLAILPDDKILAGGDWLQGGTTGNQAYVFVRYHPNGQIDTTFGTSGKAIFNFGSSHFRRMEGMAVQADGKIVGSGWDRNPSVSDANILIMRIDSNGALDPSFGNAGVTLTDYLGRNDEGIAMAMQADGKYVVAGGLNLGSGSPWWIGVVRYLP